jgi:hypothetical protein
VACALRRDSEHRPFQPFALCGPICGRRYRLQDPLRPFPNGYASYGEERNRGLVGNSPSVSNFLGHTKSLKRYANDAVAGGGDLVMMSESSGLVLIKPEDNDVNYPSLAAH